MTLEAFGLLLVCADAEPPSPMYVTTVYEERKPWRTWVLTFAPVGLVPLEVTLEPTFRNLFAVDEDDRSWAPVLFAQGPFSGGLNSKLVRDVLTPSPIPKSFLVHGLSVEVLVLDME